jgi:hypothetical protein
MNVRTLSWIPVTAISCLIGKPDRLTMHQTLDRKSSPRKQGIQFCRGCTISIDSPIALVKANAGTELDWRILGYCHCLCNQCPPAHKYASCSQQQLTLLFGIPDQPAWLLFRCPRRI